MRPFLSFIPLILYTFAKIAYDKAVESNSADHYAFQIIDFSMLSLTMLIYISIISFFVLTYAEKNFEREKNGSAWLIWSLLTVYSVDLLVISGNLLLILVAFFSISICFHKILLCFPERKKSKSVAWKKFVISRIGDFFFIGFCLLSYYFFQSENIREIQSAIANTAQENIASLTLLPSLFLAIACLIKSSQFPFHFWLPETIDAPSPISALMHAGIINAGGYLLLKFHFLFSINGLSSKIILIIGIITVFLGGLSMITQVDIKRKLAYSTLSQMGFMMIEFGLGLYPLIIVHIMGHGFYKAYGFLASGSRDLLPVSNLQGVAYRYFITLGLFIIPFAVYFNYNDIEYALISIFALSLLGQIPKTSLFISSFTISILVLISFFLIEIGFHLTGIKSIHLEIGKFESILALLSLSLLSAFTLLVPYLNKNETLSSLYCYSSRGFLTSYFSEKIFSKK